MARALQPLVHRSHQDDADAELLTTERPDLGKSEQANLEVPVKTASGGPSSTKPLASTTCPSLAQDTPPPRPSPPIPPEPPSRSTSYTRLKTGRRSQSATPPQRRRVVLRAVKTPSPSPPTTRKKKVSAKFQSYGKGIEFNARSL